MNLLHELQEAALTRLFALGTVLGPALSKGLADQGLTPARAEVIWRLQHDGPMNQRQLSEALQCSPRNVTGLVDALEEAGLAKRSPHPTDRRAILVTLTTRGEDAAADWVRQSRDLAEKLFADLPPDDLSFLVDTLDVILERLGLPLSDRSEATQKAASKHG